MSTPLRRFPDVHVTILAALVTAGLTVTGRSGIETPANLAAVVPFIRVRRGGGSSDRLNDHAIVDIDVWDARYTDVELLAERIRQWLVGPPPPAARLDRVECQSAPQELPWGDGVLRRFGATYQVTARRYTAL